MNVLVTGATGFLGTSVVDAFLERGHRVRALVRDPAKAAHRPWSGRVEVFAANLRGGGDLLPAFDGMDSLVHLAAAMNGDDAAMFAGTVAGTERLFDALGRSSVRRLVLCSSFSVYDFVAAGRVIDEQTPVARDVYRNGAYAAAKLWQERLARRLGESHGVEVTIVRPGLLWGRDHDATSCLGQRVGRVQLVFGGGRRLRLIHVENCADAIRRATEEPRAAGHVLNVVDGDSVTAWRFAGETIRRVAASSSRRPVRVLVPYWLARTLVGAVRLVSARVFGPDGRLPSMFRREEFAARFRPFRYRTAKARELLGWTAPLGFEECLRRTYGPAG
jgi:UDP-glucose 4-epimerase